MPLTVKVQTQQKILYEGEAISVTSHNTLGPFDVLPNHANFISLIKDKVVITTGSNEKVEVPLSLGVIKCYSNTVQIFLGLD